MNQSSAQQAVMDFQPQSNRPLAEQVAVFIRSKINHGQLPQGSILPASSSFDGISHVTVLKAYRQLEREGLVEIRRSRGSRVIAPLPIQQYVLITHNADDHATLYENQIVASTYNVARFADQPARVQYLPSCKIKTREYAAGMLSPVLEPLLSANLVRGVIVNHPNDLSGVMDWLNSWKLPVVGLCGKAKNIVTQDWYKAGLKAIEHQKNQGAKRITMYCPPEFAAIARKIQKDYSDVIFRTYGNKLKTLGAIGYGRYLADEHQKQPIAQCSDSLILIDDMIMLGLCVELAQRGVQVPEKIRLILCTHQSQIIGVFDRVDLLLFETDELIRQAVDVIETIIDTRKEPQIRYVPFELSMHVKF